MRALLATPKAAVYATSINLKNCTIKFKGGGTGEEITVVVGKGNFSWQESKDYEYELDAGTLDDVVENNEIPVSVTFSFKWDYLKGATGTPTPHDVLNHENEASTWDSSDSDQCRPFAVDIEVTYTPACSTSDEEIYTFADFRPDQISPDIGQRMISANGRCNITKPTTVRQAQS